MRGIIVAPQPEAVEAGALVLTKGGNAIDAAIACAFVQGVVDPLMTGIGGFGTMQIYMPSKGVHVNFDFHGRCPAATRPDMWEILLEREASDGFGFVLRGGVNEAGYQSIAVPANLRAYEDALKDFGTFDWADVMSPAIDWANRGSLVRPYMHANWMQDESRVGRISKSKKLNISRTGRTIYFREDGTLKKPGDSVKNKDLARTLERLAADGADVFYRGEIAEQIVADMKANGGLLTLRDLHSVCTERTIPLRGTYRGMDVFSSSPPGGGILLLEMLNIAESAELRTLSHNSVDYLCLLASVMQAATFDKERYVGDPAFIDVPIDKLISKSHANEIAKHISRGDRISIERLETPESRDTTHVCVVDGDNNVVSLTHSLGTASGVITDGLGFMYNSCMAAFDPRPGRLGSLAPRKARFTSMAPTLMLRDGIPQIVIGAPGGAHISGSILQAIINVVDFDMSPFEAVAAPRIAATSNKVEVSNRIPRFVTEAMEARGYAVIRTVQGFAFGAPHMLVNGSRGWSGGADPQRDGMTLRV